MSEPELIDPETETNLLDDVLVLPLGLALVEEGDEAGGMEEGDFRRDKNPAIFR